MTRERKNVITAAIITAIIFVAVYITFDKNNVFAGSAEVYMVGNELVILKGDGSSWVGDYPDPIPEGPGVRDIALGFTCIGTETLFNKIFPAFAEFWEQQHGEKVRFTTAWNGVGMDSISSVVYGKPIQVLLKTANNNPLNRGYGVTKWQKTPNKGIVYSYPYVFVVRKGNPNNVQSFEDLTRPDVKVVHMDPMGTHGGISSVFLLYAAGLKDSEIRTGQKDKAAAAEYLRQVEYNASTGFTGQTTTRIFTEGVGDVLITLELWAKKMIMDPNYEMVIPPNTYTTDIKAYKMKKNISKDDEELIDAFIDFLFREESQEAFAEAGYRPSDPGVLANHSEFEPLPGVLHMDYLGEQTKALKEIILDTWIDIRNSQKPDDEKINVIKVPDNKIPPETSIMMKQEIPEGE